MKLEEKLKFGEIRGIKVGDIFNSRKELYNSGVHMQIQAGIWGWQDEGACSIVLSDGYEDDVDEVNYILYTGHGGQEGSRGLQVKDQEFLRGNKALALSMRRRLPVRVTRGHQIEHGPKYGYRYDGIYYVENFYEEKGKSGFKIYRYELRTDRSIELIKSTF